MPLAVGSPAVVPDIFFQKLYRRIHTANVERNGEKDAALSKRCLRYDRPQRSKSSKTWLFEKVGFRQ
jgi:hypothetical protein